MQKAMLALITTLVTVALAGGILVAVPGDSLVEAQTNTETVTETASATLTATGTMTATATATITATATTTATTTTTTTPTRPTISLPVEPYTIYLPVVRVSGNGPTPTQTASPTLTPTSTSSRTPVPTASPTSTRTPTPTQEPHPEVRAVNATGGYDGSDDYLVFGEVVNSGAISVYTVKVTAKFYDGSGTLLATDSNYTMLDLLTEGQRVPFRISLSDAPSGIASYALQTQICTCSSHSQLLTIASQQISDNDGVAIVGTVHNNQATEVSSFRVAATFYNASGEVVYAAYTNHSDESESIPPGGTASFQISIHEQGLVYDHVVVQAEG